MMKNIKKILVIIGVVIAIIILDSILALSFDISPLVKIRKYYNGGNLNYVDRGILVDTYCGTNGIRDTTIKGFSYSLAYDPNIEIVDKSLDIKDFACDTALEPFYEDGKYIYSFECIKSDYIVVKYSDGTEETVKEALKNNHIDIGYLDKFDIHYIKIEKNNGSNMTLPYIPDGMDVASGNEGNIFASDKTYNHDVKNVTIEVLKDSITNKSLVILITDNNKDHYGWGKAFKIQRKENEEWKDLMPIRDLVFEEIAYSLDSNNQLKQVIDIEKYYGKLNEGIYRIVKSVYDKAYIDLYSNEFQIL